MVNLPQSVGLGLCYGLWPVVLISISVAVIKCHYHPKQLGENGVYFILELRSQLSLKEVRARA